MPLVDCLEPVWDVLPGGVQLLVKIDAVAGLAGGIALAYNAAWAKKKVQDDVVPKVLDTLAENKYDEALLRTYRDKANGYVRKVVFALMYSSLASLWFLNFTKSALPAFLLAISMFFTGSFHFRYQNSMDSEKDFPLLGREFHRFYPFINEDSAFARRNKMEKNSELEHKAQRIIQVRKSEFVFSLGKLLLVVGCFLTTVAFMAPFGGIKMTVMGDLSIVGLMLASYLTRTNANLTTVFSSFQRYMSMLVLRRPMYSVDAPPFNGNCKSFEDMHSTLKVAHYHHSMRCFPPFSSVLHSQVYEKFRKEGKTIGFSMAMVSAAQLLTHIVLLVTFQAGNKNLMSTLIPLTVFYGIQGGFKYIEQDGMVEAFKGRQYRRDEDTKAIAFGFYKFFMVIAEFALYVKPMTLLFLDGYDSNGWTQKAA